METDRSDLVSIGEAAKILGVHVDTVRRWADHGKLRAVVLPSGHRRFRLSDLEALLNR